MEELVRKFHERAPGTSRQVVTESAHREAEMTLFEAGLAPLSGSAAILAALATTRADLFRAQVRNLEWLDDQTILATGNARYPLPEVGWAEGQVFWLNEFREGLLWRIRGFRTEAEARRAFGMDRE